MSFAVEVKDRLIAAGLVTSWNFFIGVAATIPAGAGPYTQMSPTGGSGDDLTQNDFDSYEQPSAQLIITASVRSVAEDKADAIRNNLKSVRNELLGTSWYRSILADQQVFDFPLDTSNRPRCGFNISAIRRP